MAGIRVALADDHPIYRQGLYAALETIPGVEAVGEASSCRELASLVTKTFPDVVLLDVRMGEDNGLAAVEKIRETSPRTRVIAITAYDDEEILTAAVQAGVDGFLVKDAGLDDLAAAIRAVASGKGFISPSATKQFLQLAAKLINQARGPQAATSIECLTPREKEVLALAREGLTNRQIADRLLISENTVHNHLINIYRKLGLTRRRQLLASNQ